MKKLLSLILALSILLLSSAYADIHLADSNNAPISNINNQTVKVGESLSVLVKGTNDNGDILNYNYGSLPGFASINLDTYVITFTPTQENLGAHNLDIRMWRDEEELQVKFSVTVEEELETLYLVDSNNNKIDKIDNQTVKVGESLSVLVKGNDATNYNYGSLPGFASINLDTYVITFTPTQENLGAHNLDILISKGEKELQIKFSVTVEEKTEPIVISSPSNSNSGGSSGGSSRRSTTNDISKRTSLDVDIVNGVGRYLDLGNKGLFDFKGEEHTVYVKQIKEDSAVLVFQSEPIEVELKIGETKQIDINEDGKSDLNVKLVNIYSGMAEVLVKEITEKVEVKTEVKEETKTGESKGMEGATGAAVKEFGIKNYAVGVTLILIAAIVVVLVMRVKRNNKTDEL